VKRLKTSALSDDETCMAAIATGSTRAFKAVMDTYMMDVFRFSYSLLGDSSRAEDITQETFLRLWSHGRTWSPTGRLKSWLLKIAHHLCIDDLRKTKGHVNVDDVTAILVDKTAGPREVMVDLQTADILKAALFTLPERQRAAIMLVHYHDRTNIEAADIMGVSVDALESLLARGRRQLRTDLNDQKINLLGE
jgi:RNA polymerase sigma-70 factor, ECF subfamily